MYHRHGVGTTIAFGVVARLRLIAQKFLRRVCTTSTYVGLEALSPLTGAWFMAVCIFGLLKNAK